MTRIGLALLALPLVLGGCGGRPAPTAESAVALTVTAVAPLRRQVEREVVASGSVAAWQEMSLGVELSGLRVAQVRVEVGDRVVRGQALLELDRRTLEVQARQAEAALAQARASVGLARAQATRGEQLLAEKLISSSNYDELQANLARAEAQLVSAEAERDAAALRLGFATLRAPDGGVISARNVQPGQVVSQGAELLRLIRGGRLEWRAEVAEADLPRIARGARVELRGPTGDSVVGRIRAVSPALDPKTRTAVIYADLPDPGALRAGMFAEGRLGVGVAEVMVLPREAVVYRDGYPYVFVLGKDSRVAQRRVEVGATSASGIELRSGVAAGERVAARGAGFLGDGDLVRVVPGA
jgi:RND family efflux transporter MFP subunit